MNLQLKKGNQLIATVSKKLWSYKDRFGIQIEGGHDTVLILGCCVILEKHMHHDGKGKDYCTEVIVQNQMRNNLIVEDILLPRKKCDY